MTLLAMKRPGWLVRFFESYRDDGAILTTIAPEKAQTFSDKDAANEFRETTDFSRGLDLTSEWAEYWEGVMIVAVDEPRREADLLQLRVELDKLMDEANKEFA